MRTALLLSGGMDSATCLWWVQKNHPGEIHTISIDYHQRHRVELDYAARLAARAGVHTHKVIELDLASIGGSPLTDTRLEVPTAQEERQGATVVPFRNMLFVTLAAAYAETQDIQDLMIAPVRDDYQAYRDCRPGTGAGRTLRNHPHLLRGPAAFLRPLRCLQRTHRSLHGKQSARSSGLLHRYLLAVLTTIPFAPILSTLRQSENGQPEFKHGRFLLSGTL